MRRFASSYGDKFAFRGRLGQMPISLLFYLAAAFPYIYKADGTIVQHDGVHPVPAPFGPGVITITDSSTVSPANLSSVAATSDVNTIPETSSTTAPAPTLPLSGILPAPDGAIPPASVPSFVTTVVSVPRSGTAFVSTQSPSVLQNPGVPDAVNSAMGMSASEIAAMSMSVTGELSPGTTSLLPTSPTNLEDSASAASTLSAISSQLPTALPLTPVMYTTVSIFETLFPSQTQSPSNVTSTQLPMAASATNTSSLTTSWSAASSTTTTTTTSNLTTTLRVQTTVIITTTPPAQTLSISQTGTGDCTTQGPQLPQPSVLPVRRLFSNITSFSTNDPESEGLCISVFTTTVYVTPAMPETWPTITVFPSTPSTSLSTSLSTLPFPTSPAATVSVTSYLTLSSVSILPVVAGASTMPDSTSMVAISSTTPQQQTTVLAATVGPTSLDFSSMVASYTASSQKSTLPTNAFTSATLPTVASSSALLNFSSMVASYRSSGAQVPTTVPPRVSVPTSRTSLLKISSTVISSSTRDHKPSPLQASIFSPVPTLAATVLNFSSMVASYRTRDAKPSRTSVFKDPALSHLKPVTITVASEHSTHTSGVQGHSDGNALASWVTNISKPLVPLGRQTPTTLVTLPRPTTSASATLPVPY